MDDTYVTTTQESKHKPVENEPATEVNFHDEDPESASESNGATESEIEVQFPTALPAIAPLAVDAMCLVVSRPPPSSTFTIEEDKVAPAAPGVVNLTLIKPKTVPAEIFAAPLNATQVVDDPVSNGGIPTTTIDVMPAGASTMTLAEATGATVPRPVATIPLPVATAGSSTRAVVFGEGKEDLKENDGPVTTSAGIKKAREGFFGSRRSSRAEDERGTKRFRLSDRIRMRPLRAVRSNSK